MYTRDEVYESTLAYFGGDDLAATVFFKYVLRDKQGNFLELNPDDMHRRLAKEFARIESNYPNPMSEEYIYSFLKDFKYIVPQGSPMMGIGNDFTKLSLSNCVVVASPPDSISGIMDTGKDLANLFKRRCVEANTLVWTQHGLVPIKNVNAGDEVLSLNTDTQDKEYQQVLDKFKTDVSYEDRIIITLNNGTQLKTSKKHPVLVCCKESGQLYYKNAGDLCPHDVLIKPSANYQDSWHTLTDKRIGWFIGCHMGDGSCDIVTRPYNSKLTTVRFRCAGDNESVIKRYTSIFNTLSKSQANYHISSRKDYQVPVWEYSNANNGNQLLNKKYLDNQIGKKTITGFIPSYIKQFNLYPQFIAGLADADGTIKNGSLVIALSAKAIIDELGCWLSRQGIRFHIGINQPKRENESTRYILTINTGQEILDYIAIFMCHEDKKNNLNQGKAFSHKYVITNIEYNQIINRYNNLHGLQLCRGNLAAIISLLHKEQNGCGIQALDEFLKNDLISYQQYQRILSRVGIKSINQDFNSTEYFDIEVANNNNFFAGNYGLVNIHNCGVGLDISSLRPDGTPVSNAAKTTSGAWSFADLYSFICRMIGQNGRRGALMITMDVRHPDIMKFIRMKQDLTKVTGANISVKLTDDFMRAVEEDKEYSQYWPVVELEDTFDHMVPDVWNNIRAREVWDAIVESATKTAEPGILMWDNIIKNLPAHCYPDFKTSSTNPCSELALSSYDSCRLISINLKNFILEPFKSSNAKNFDWDTYKETVAVATRLSDDLIDLEIEKINQILAHVDEEDEKILWNKMLSSCVNGRRIGLGTHGLADSLARICLRYDSDEAVEHIDKIYSILRNEAYQTSVDLANERGSFPVFDWELEKDNDFIQSLPPELQHNIREYGRRNISLLTNAPTGSVSILCQCSSGIEPVFQLSYTRRRKRNHDEELQDTDYIDDMGDRWEEFEVFHHNLREYLDDYTDTEFDVDNLPNYFITSSEIDWERRIKVQATIQEHIDHAISSTINLPKGTTSDVVGNLYLQAWRKGLKGLTVYVDGSRSGVLVNKKEEEKKFGHVDSVKRPDCLVCDIHHVSVKGEKWTILVGKMDSQPYEVFGGLANEIEIPKKYTHGIVCKRVLKSGKNIYDLALEDGFKFKNVVKLFDNQLYQVHTRMISLALRHGTRPSFLVEQLLKDPDNDLTSFSKVVARVLKTYISDGTTVTSDKMCPQCKTEGLVYQDGCPKCVSCGWTKCQ